MQCTQNSCKYDEAASRDRADKSFTVIPEQLPKNYVQQFVRQARFNQNNKTNPMPSIELIIK